MINNELLRILVCPESKRPVALADDGLVGDVNEMIRSRRARNRAGEVVDNEIDGGLLTEDRSFLYPIREEIPVMLVDQAIVLRPE